MIVMCIVVMIATPKEQLGYNFPLDEGINKLTAATIALMSAIWGAIEIKKSLFIWGGMVVVMELLADDLMLFGAGTIFSSLFMCAVAAIWANKDAEIKDFLLTLFKDDEK